MIKHLITLLCLLGLPLQAEFISAKAKRVVDGDTLLLVDGTRVQIWGIDAPEKGQAYAEKATAFLNKAVKGKKLKLKVRDTDQYGRKVAEVSAGSTDLALSMLRAGLAWHDDYNAPDATKLVEAMKKARKAKKGLWADKNPVKPYLFRKGETAAAAEATPAEGEVLCQFVMDGDTFRTADGTRVRLWGIDAPEKGQPYADSARARLKALCEGKPVQLEWKDKDQHQRTVAVVWCGGVNINLKLIQEGLAWHYAYFAPDASDFATAESAARKARAGLWADDDPVNPYEFRKQLKR